MDTGPIWREELAVESYPRLGSDIETEILVIGGGITGITAAWLLAQQGKSVTLVERETIGRRDTAHTTAHLTYMTDTRLSDLVATFSRREAKQAWEAGAASMRLIRKIVEDLSIDCDLTEVPGYLAAAVGTDIREERSLLERESEMAHQFGFDVRLVDEAEMAHQFGFDVRLVDEDPVTERPAIRFAKQLEFHPLKYLHSLAGHAASKGAKIHEHTEVTEFLEQPRRVKAGAYFIRYEKIVIATHVPLQGSAGTLGAAMFQTKLAPYSTYAIAARIPLAAMREMVWSDTADPFLYLRMSRQAGHDHGVVILGGEDHKTGKEIESSERFRTLEKKLSRMIPEAEVTHRWSGQVVETVDGLPYIGATDESQFIATGFSGNGLTFGTVAALMAADWVAGRENPWKSLFDPGRRTLGCLKEYLAENVTFPIRMITDRLGIQERDPQQLKPGEASVMEHDCKRLAAYRDDGGKLTVVSAVCPHMGCIVAWNEAERTWDCPCHGSRFAADGRVIAGPAESDLEEV